MATSTAAPAGQPQLHEAAGAAQHDPLAALDGRLERLLGADMRMIYGLLAPVLLICGVIIVLALKPSSWLVALTVVLELAALAFVVVKLLAMLGDADS